VFSRLRHWSHRVFARLPALLPSSCALCGAHGNASICEGCHRQFFSVHVHRCIRCGISLPTVTGTTCGNCLKHPPAFDATIVASDYAPPVDQLVLALKFGNRLELAPLFAGMLRDAALNAQEQAFPTRLAVVPLGSRRLVERGFNQSLEIAKPLSRALGVPVERNMLIRQRETTAQALLHPDERHRNVRKAFIVAGDAMDRVRGQHIGVVDDVMTTGETLNEVAATLKRFGAARVTNFVFARTVPS
jgi:ComF family protein